MGVGFREPGKGNWTDVDIAYSLSTSTDIDTSRSHDGGRRSVVCTRPPTPSITSQRNPLSKAELPDMNK